MAEIIPYLLYEDVAAALEFLGSAFGLEEVERYENEGRLAHAEMRLDGARVMMGDPGDDYRGPAKVGAVTALIYVYVDDVDAHFEGARAAGAEIKDELKDQPYGDRSYSALDPEGHHWYFAQRLGA